MDALADCLTAGEIEDALDSLPQGINDTYDQVMRRVEKLSFNRRRAVKRLLQWVSYAKRPLTIRELEHAIAVSRGVQELHADHIINAKVLTSLSAGIVIVDENERVRLTHKTAEDYFIQRRAAFFLNGDVDITECCLAYLQLAGFESGPCEEPNQSAAFQLRLKDYPFYEYASVYWGDHAQACDPAVITPQALMFLRNKPLLEASVQALCYLDTTSVNSWDVAGGIDALHLVSFFGLTDIVAHLLHEGADPNTLDPLGTTPLIYACAKGHTQVAETLLQEGALPHTVDLRGSTALLRSVQNSHFDLTRRILLENDVAINTLYKSVKNYTALMLACWNSDAQTLKLLLQRPEIDVNVSNPSSGTTALIMSALEGEMECVELLVRHPAIDINQQDHSGYTATHYAALYGYVASLELLLKAGADTSVRDDDGGRALQRAIDYGSIDTVKLLLHHNAEYDFKDSLGRTIIHAAAVNNQAKVLEHILQTCKDLNVDSQGNQGETALHDAARHGYTPTVEVLLKFGARTDIVNNAGETPVKLARDADWTEVLDALRKARTREIESSENIKTMLLRKADTFVVKSETSLATAVQFDTFEAIKTRIERASLLELNDPSSEFNSTSLHCACEYGRPEVVTLLLEAGAFVDPMDSFSRTPLIIACQSGETNIVRSLLEYGADPNHAKFGNRKPWEIALGRRATRTALFLLAQPQTEIDADSRLLSKALTWAAALGDLKACKRLVEGGAPLYLKNSDGVTPAQIAKEWYQHEVERYLLEQDAKYRTALRLDFPNTGSSKVEEIMNDGPDEGGHPPTRPPATKKELIKLTAPPDSQDILLDLNTKEQGVFQRGRTQASLILAFVLLSGLLLAILATVLLSEVKVLPP